MLHGRVWGLVLSVAACFLSTHLVPVLHPHGEGGRCAGPGAVVVSAHGRLVRYSGDGVECSVWTSACLEILVSSRGPALGFVWSSPVKSAVSSASAGFRGILGQAVCVLWSISAFRVGRSGAQSLPRGCGSAAVVFMRVGQFDALVVLLGVWTLGAELGRTHRDGGSWAQTSGMA